MTWKTDWLSSDNYARNGAADLTRLISNYQALRDMLNSEYGFAVSITVPTTDGYRTMPFADVLNLVEQTLGALEVWQKQWPPNKTWQPTGSAPTFDDINRWESCGAEIERYAHYAASIFIHSGMNYSGLEGIRS